VTGVLVVLLVGAVGLLLYVRGVVALAEWLDHHLGGIQ
jgi:hypothetical protein